MGDYTNRQSEAYDAEQVLLTAGTITASLAAAAGASNAVNIGENVEFDAKLQVRGAVSGTNPTMAIAIHESATEGGSYTLVEGCTFATQTATGADITIRGRTTLPWIAAVVTAGGTNPSFADVEVFVAS